MQKAYLKLDISEKEVKNWHYMLSVYHVLPKDWYDLIDVATEVCAESSNWTFVRVKTATDFSDTMWSFVYKIDKEKNLVWIAFPIRLFDRWGNIQNIFTYIAWNVYWMSSLKWLKLLDVWFPRVFLENYDWPSYNIDDMREYLWIYDRPIIWTIVKPKIWLTASEYAEVCYDYWSWGWDFVKNDEPQADQDFAPYEKLVKYVKEAMDKAVKETWNKKIHSFNVSSPDFNEMIRRCEMIRETFEHWSYAFLIDWLTAWWMAVQTLRRLYPDVFIHFHRAWHWAFTRPENPFWYSVLVLSKFARLAWASWIHTWTAGIWKMEWDKWEDIISANNIVSLLWEWHFFSQNWWEIQENDEDLLSLIHEDSIHHVTLHWEEWRAMLKTTPIVSWWMTPLKLKAFVDAIWHVDFITTMWWWVHAHPKWTKWWATAQIQAAEAMIKWIDINEYAKTHEELELAIEFYKNK